MLGVLTWLRAYVLGVFKCLRADVFGCLRVCLLTSLACLRVNVVTYLVCLRVYVRACYDKMCSFLTCLRVGVLFCLICFTFQYLNLKILTAKNLCALLSWRYFLLTLWSQLKQYYFFKIYIFTYYINFCWTHCFCLIYCQSSYWLLLLLDNIPW